MKNKLFTTLFCGLSLFALVTITSCNQNPSVELTEEDTQRGFTQTTDDVVVEMPDEVVYLKDDVNKNLQNYDPDSGTITFSNSDELSRQKVKVGDILYSAERTAKAPDGYSLKVTKVTKNGNSVTLETEPASILEVFNHLEESASMDFGAIKEEDIQVPTIIAGANPAQTKAVDVSTADGILNFTHSDTHTSFDWVFYKQYSSKDPTKLVYQMTIGLDIQHESYDDSKNSVLIDCGKIVLFSMVKMGVVATFKLEGGEDLSEEETALELSNVSHNLLDKKYDLKIAPVPLGFANLAINPWIVVSFQFGMGVSGNITIEAGIENQVLAFNLENTGYFVPEFIGKSYIRQITNGQPTFRMKAEAEANASVSIGPGIRFEIPGLRIHDDAEGWIPSYAGPYILCTLSGDAHVEAVRDIFSGSLSLNAHGSADVGGEVALQGKVGFKDKVGTVDLRIPLITKNLGEWSWSWLMESPTPYNLKTEVNGEKAVFSWDSEKLGLMPVRYDIYLDAGEGYVLYQPKWPDKNFEFVSEQDGDYRWKVTTRTIAGKEYPCAEDQSFSIIATKVRTETPVIDGKNLKVSVSGSFTTRNRVKEYGVAFSQEEDFDGQVGYHKGAGTPDKFTVEISPVPNHYSICARAYVIIKCAGGVEKTVFGNLQVVSIDEQEIQLSVRPDKLDFGGVTVGKDKTMTLVILNDGLEDGRIKVIPPDDDFPLIYDRKQFVVRKGERESLAVTFTPGKAFDKWDSSMVLDAYDKDGIHIQRLRIPVSGSGIKETKPVLKASPTFLDFPETVVGAFSELSWTITNTGDADLKVSSLDVPEGFITDFSTWDSKTVAPGGDHVFRVRFHPSEAKVYSGKIVLKSNAANAPEASFTIGGKGLPKTEPKISVKPSTISFGDVNVGEKVVHELTISNTGNAPLKFESVTSTFQGFGTDFNSWKDKSINPNESRKLEVYFMPGEARNYSSTINIKTNAVNVPEVAVPVSGKGITVNPNGPKIKVEPESLDFGKVTALSSAEATISITNIGNEQLDIYSVGQPRRFMTFFDDWEYTASIQPGASRDLNVLYFPELSSGRDDEDVVIKSNAVNNPSLVVHLSGQSYIPEGNPKISLGVTSITFDDTHVGYESYLHFEFQNTGGGELWIQSIEVPDGFEISDAAIAYIKQLPVLPGSVHSSFRIGFKPTAEKTYDGSIVVKSNAVDNPELKISIRGKGFKNKVQGYNDEYVDMGYAGKWAKCNLGAVVPEGIGAYYAWGETSPRGDYSMENYQFLAGEPCTYTKYNPSDGLTVLEPEDDAAYVHLGKGWRIPTGNDWRNLLNRCDFVWTTINGVNGYKVTCRDNGNWIFLPDYGWVMEKRRFTDSTRYWTSEVGKEGVWTGSFELSSNKHDIISSNARDCCAFLIRPVKD